MISSLKKELSSSDKSGVIWISGFSSAGKTTIGRKVESLLRSKSIKTIFLDGDDLRSIFSERWGYERDERLELSRVYFRLCSHLASQGYCVVISAIAMYSEVREWLRENVPGVLEIYLEVPDVERRERDFKNKQVYGKIGNVSKMYDLPDERVFKLKNYGDQTPEITGLNIVNLYLSKNNNKVDFGRIRHWSKYYSSESIPLNPSLFAIKVNNEIEKNSKLIEIGCGNGRDSSFFAGEGHTVVALDPSESAIETCRNNDVNFLIDYKLGTLPDLIQSISGKFNLVYSRFVIHAMPLVEEKLTIESAAKILHPGGKLFIECRSINDPMARQGEIISSTERIQGHYRRFIVKEELESRLVNAGFKILESVESKGLAVFRDSDPMIIRVVSEFV